MKTRTIFIVVSAITILLMAAGAAGAIANRLQSSPTVAAAPVSSGTSYQGRLTSSGGTSLNGNYTMRFRVYNAAVGGAVLWDSGNQNVTVEDGLFNVKLAIDQADFNGQALWLSIAVAGETLSPRQEILPAPYALGLRPGVDIVGDSIGATNAVFAGYAPATGTALYASANGGAGLVGISQNNLGVQGSSSNGWGGHFTSNNGNGIVVSTNGSDHWDHAATFQANSGYSVYATSSGNMAIRGEAGDTGGLWQPVGHVGVVGIGQSRGMYGSAGSSYGMYGTSLNWYGIYGRTSRTDNNYGLYTPDNLFSSNVNLTGAIMQVMQNGGSEPLAPGDVVLFSGIDQSVTTVDGPIVQVSRAETANSTAVAGVVFSRFNMDAIDPDLESPDGIDQGAFAGLEVTPDGSAAPGEYVLVVVQGPAQVRVQAASDIQPGDLLSTSLQAGAANKAERVTMGEVEMAVPGTVFGKALETVNESDDLIYVYVTLQ